jgi:thioester reductase-like protein
MNIFLTGATGFVGGELLVTLSSKAEIDKIFCFIRSGTHQDALSRIKEVFNLHNDYFDENKIIPIIGNLFDKDLTKSLSALKQLNQTDVIIHSAANTSFSRINDGIVEEVNIGGLKKILLWAKDLPHLQTFLYIGSATSCGMDIKNRVIFEEESPDISVKHLVRYTYTKMQGELLIKKYLPAEKILITRPSIIMGDSRPLMPRSPVILWTVATINQLRLIPVNEHASLDMIPVDYAAQSIVNLLFSRRKYQIYHISAGRKGSTSTFKLSETLSGYFTGLPPFLFVDKLLLPQVKQWAKHKLKADSELNSYAFYLDYWKKTFTDPGKLRVLFAGLEPYLQFIELGQIFDNSRLLEDLPSATESLPADIYIKNCLPFIDKINIMEGAIDP